ncbi:MAG: ABC transporter permease subunit, partial [Verrucomicrobia bacterium]|nr:ABC transporter permease subunit [Verrucomicrobiota bacterium]
MTFLPIVERELRVAARRRSTFWVRIVGALVAVLIGAGFLAMSTVFGAGFGAVSLGSGLFATLTWISLFAVLGAGLFLTSDCLSEEKREGTIGFLFLTDLRGHDVVAGKLLATSLQGFYALLAVLPILAITFVLGGVTGEQFWKTALALLNALFLSLGAGLFVSALSRDSQKAMAGTLLLLLLLAGGGPAGDAFIAWLRKGSFDPVLSRSSPVYLFIAAGASGGAAFWPALLVNQIVAWTLFAATCVLLPRTWQEKGGESSASASPWTQWWKYGGARRRSALRKKLVEVNPVLWLVCRERWQGDMLWFMALCLTAAFGVLYFNYGDGTGWVFWSYLGGLLTLVLYLGVASQACRFLVDARRSGVLELLLATPLTDREIVRGQWRGLLRMFGLPLLLCLAIQFGGNYLSQVQMLKVMGTAAAAIPA